MKVEIEIPNELAKKLKSLAAEEQISLEDYIINVLKDISELESNLSSDIDTVKEKLKDLGYFK